ncbi:MAG: carbamoyl phosphate synthase small subunit [Clostridiales bacterium]|nr:carbamoyl phosphate synthase small subunit [Clostridiales bacterium]
MSGQGAYLLLEDGSRFEGEPLGAAGLAVGEAVFSTLLTGHQRLLTSPVTSGQLLTLTSPLIGNVGHSRQEMEGERVYAAGLIVRECAARPSNFRAEGPFEAFLTEQGVVGLQGVDTRALTRHLRSAGRLRGAIVSGVAADDEALLAQLGALEFCPDLSGARYTPAVQPTGFLVAVVDYGCGDGLLRQLEAQNCRVRLLPPDFAPEQAAGADGLLLSDGPERLDHPVEALTALLHSGLPMLGIGTGHLTLARAAGCDLLRLPCGHRGANYPVTVLEQDCTVITEQHHGCAVCPDSAAAHGLTVSHINRNDGSVEGLRYGAAPCLSVQFTPPDGPWPQGGETVLETFCGLMAEGRGAHA